VFIIHLALGKRARLRQMAFVSELVTDYPHAVVMGDLNCEIDSDEMDLLLARTDLRAPLGELHTFPSWRPRRRIDHILVSPSLDVDRIYVPQWLYSDHLPVAMDVILPSAVAVLS
jgi:endonuclease/exonuclease/phosphatase family metal-dependent hydrolase